MRTIFHTKHFNEDIKESVNVIISPEFYWIKRIEAPVKRVSEAKKISKNLFKLDNGNYYFGAIKCGEKFYAIAVERDIKLNIDKKYINAIYTAQSELCNYDNIKIDKNHALKKIEDILFCFPDIEKEDLCLDDILPTLKLSSQKIDIFQNSIKKSSVVFGFFIFFAINFYIGTLGYAYHKEIKNIENRKYFILEKSKLPKTTYQLKSIYDNLLSMDLKQKKIKKALEYISNTNSSKFIKISYDRYFNVEINSTKNFDSYFKRFFRVRSVSKPYYKAVLSYE